VIDAGDHRLFFSDPELVRAFDQRFGALKAWAEARQQEESGAPKKAPDGPGKEEAGGKAEVPWTDNAPEYLPNSEAVKLAEGRLEVKELYRLLTPFGVIRYMRKGHRGKVHLQDFRRYLTNRPDLESAITDELIDKHLSGIATRKAEIDRQRRAK
jgi:hypothetical protein